MLVTRRTALKRLALVSAGAALLPACFRDHPRPTFQTKHFQLDEDQEKLVEELTATIIPGGATPGAREVSAYVFVLKMLDDCSSAAQRDKFLRGLQRLDDASRQAAGTTFLKADPSQRGTVLAALETQKLPDQDLNFFYSTTKKWTIQAYTSSRYYLTRIQVYELVPGRWHGCVPVKTQPNAS